MYRVKYDKDNGLKALMRKFGKKVIARVGIQGKQMYQPLKQNSDFSMVDLGYVHEYGSVKANVPQRSFLRSTADENRKRYENTLKRIARKTVRNPEVIDLNAEVYRLGENVRRNVIQKINSNIPPPLAEATIDNKEGDDLALVDTGLMIGSITSVISNE